MPLSPAMILRNKQLVEKNARPVRASGKERSYSEENITPELSLTVSSVLAAFTILSEDLSSLPLMLYERRGRSKFRAYDSIYYRLMHDQPNPEHTSMIFREIKVGHLLGWGNFYGQMILDKAGDVQEIWPLRPDRMTVERVNGERIYRYRTPDGQQRVFLSDEILHIPAFGFDGLIGYSRITMARNAIGLSISTEKYGSKFFSNGANFDIVIKHPDTLSDLAYKHLTESIEEEHKGIEKSHKPMILEENMTIDKIGIPPDDAQFLETRKFQVSEIARIFRVPPHMIGDVERTTSWGSGIDSQEQGYVNHTLRPWARRIEEALNARVLLERDRQTFFYEHLMDGLLRGDIQTRYEAYVKAITNGFMSRNEVRERENMNPRKGLDDMLQQANLTTVTTSTGGNGSDPPGNALEPLWRDAVARVMKREAGDLGGVLKRFHAKGQKEAFTKWLDQFYGVDHPAFMKKQFQPIIDAQSRLFGIQDDGRMEKFVSQFMDQRREQIKATPVDQLSSGMDEYIAFATQMIMSFVEDYIEFFEEAAYEL